jgi:hypothetical protein
MQAYLDDLLRFCVPELPGAPDSLIVNALNDASVRLCRESACWNTWVDVTLESGVSEYSLTPPETNSRAFTIRKALFNGREFRPTPEDQLAMINPAMFNQQGTPTTYWMSGINKVSVLPLPSDSDAGRVIKMRVSWTPTSAAKAFDSELMERYMDAILFGAKAKLMRQPGQTWSNEKLSAYYEMQTTIEVGKARIDQMQDMTVGSLKTSPRVFGRG